MIKADLSDLDNVIAQHRSLMPALQEALETVETLGATTAHLLVQIGTAKGQVSMGNFSKASSMAKAIQKDIQKHIEVDQVIKHAETKVVQENSTVGLQLIQSAKDSLDKGWYEVAAQSANEAIV